MDSGLVKEKLDVVSLLMLPEKSQVNELSNRGVVAQCKSVKVW